MIDWDALIHAAAEARANAHAPYSVYQVGAAVLCESGRIYVGANVENASFGATICAERSAVSAMVAQGERRIRAVVVITQDGGSPCGICRQVLVEFAPSPADVDVMCLSQDGRRTVYNLGDLLPARFELKEKPI